VPFDPVELLSRLVATPSVNPMNREVTGAIYGEGRLTELLIRICQEQGWPWSRREVHPGRDNLLIRFDGDPPPNEGGELLLWDVHQDTVPIEDMIIEPFGGAVCEGRVYGRGACDVKGSMATMLTALSQRSESGMRPTIVLACTVNEECGYTGARSLSQLWTDEAISRQSDFFPRAPDAAIVAEPTGLDVVIAHQGQVRWRCHAIGRAAHTSRPDAGINAIYALAKVVQAIERYHGNLSTSGADHPLCGRPSVCVSTIHGGVGINTVPERATIEIDRRLAPGESPDLAHNALVRFITEHADVGRCRIQHDEPFMQSNGLSDDMNRTLAERVARTVQQNGGAGKLVGVRFGTDAAAIAASGIRTVVFGPGSIDQAHTADEFIAIDQLKAATEIFRCIATEGLR
jgi:acetylornithine deacetylase